MCRSRAAATALARSLFGFAILLSPLVAGSVHGQLVGLADDIIIISKGLSNRETARKTTALGHVPGSTAVPFRYDPGGRGNHLEEPTNPARSRVRIGGGHPSALAAATARPHALSSARRLPPPQTPALQQRLPPLYGLLELPTAQYEGPADGLTLDQAIERLVRVSPDLRSKRYEIPEARADVLTAGLRANPLFFLSASNYPYQAYSPARPGAVQYSPTLIQPFDANHKRQARVDAATRALRVLEAQYQNAVRLAIDDLYVVFTDVIVARETRRYAEISLTGAKALFDRLPELVEAGEIGESDALSLSIQYETARLSVSQAQSELLRAKHRLAALLAMDREQATRLEVRGFIRPPETPLPPRHELVQTALDSRPDLLAFRLGIRRAQADVRVARKERFDDLFVVYSPYQFQNNGAIGAQNTTSYSFGLMGSVPLFDRNQGEIRRAELNVAQTRAALAARQREAVREVENALLEHDAGREAVERIESVILPASEKSRAIAYREHEAGRTSAVEYVLALRDHNEVIRYYRDALIRHRRSMLQLNTAVGRRLLP